MSLTTDLQFLVDVLASSHPHDWGEVEIEIIKESLRSALAAAVQAQQKLSEIVCTTGEDAGVIFKNTESPTQYSEILKCHVYLHNHFSELGDALVDLWRTTFASEEMDGEKAGLNTN